MATHSRTKDCQKRGTATQHAERNAPCGRPTLLDAETVQAMEDAKANRANYTIDNLLDNLAAFFLFLLEDVWGHATKHEDDEDVCRDIVHDKNC